MQIERITARGQLVGFTFLQDAVAASQTNANLPVVETGATSGTTSIAGYVAPFAGEVIGVSAKVSSAATAGSLTIGPQIDGTEDTALQLSITTETEKSNTVPRGTIKFDKDAEIGAEITTDGSWDGTSSDLGVVVWVLLEVDGI